MTDNMNLHDEAADAAERTVADLRNLSAEGIPQRVSRIKGELFAIVEAAWLAGGVQFEALRGGTIAEEETRKHALRMHQMTSMIEASLFTAIKALEPLGSDRAGEDFDALLDSVLENLSAEWMHEFFTGVYADRERDEKVLRLNALLHKKRDPKREQGNG